MTLLGKTVFPGGFRCCGWCLRCSDARAYTAGQRKTYPVTEDKNGLLLPLLHRLQPPPTHSLHDSGKSPSAEEQRQSLKSISFLLSPPHSFRFFNSFTKNLIEDYNKAEDLKKIILSFLLKRNIPSLYKNKNYKKGTRKLTY